ncbi:MULTISPECIES: hypothetical protein [unclassified Rhizobium]|uniref:hypothetical protein n=1 Tax=unclassified Rhizobium TaxID=2613769 RepID=UPI00146BEAE1|nr:MULTISPECIES: hypothetical protein [unclassified Rhizobium]MBD9445740.1 hypothetical protein [Rhizobium sp. RHZ01]NMN73839.1 hypothetical protein [Rhizobium sp. 57MFTsu3.2]
MKTLEDLIPKLSDKTRDGSIRWMPGPNTQYKTEFGKFRVHVWKWQEPEDETEGISIGLRTGDDNNPFLDVIAFDTYSSRYSRLDDLYSMARRSALQIDLIIEDADAELDKMFPS